MEKKVVKLHPKIDRNSPCPCGSGKKYKKCCLSKHEEEERHRQRINTPEAISDNYFPVEEYIQKSGYPVTLFDYFLIEILNITGSIINEHQKLDDAKVKTILSKIMEEAKEFYSGCQKCENDCLSNPMKKVSLKSLIDKGLMVEYFQEVMQRPVALNFFYFEFINVVVSILKGELNKILPEHEAEDITWAVQCSLFGFISNNCWEGCVNNCMNNSKKNAYCLFCSFGDSTLPCPKEGDISCDEIKACAEDMMH